jgi:hypothetical protein
VYLGRHSLLVTSVLIPVPDMFYISSQTANFCHDQGRHLFTRIMKLKGLNFEGTEVQGVLLPTFHANFSTIRLFKLLVLLKILHFEMLKMCVLCH